METNFNKIHKQLRIPSSLHYNINASVFFSQVQIFTNTGQRVDYEFGSQRFLYVSKNAGFHIQQLLPGSSTGQIR